ncbi:hypothetical protein WMY93_008139 [Mugilogobius chulae]|uniref:Uncharacterized protein n=1 Tax=Mugilogobius chulae TaxID=88201 RepID=A0AAW0PTQ2_9GOBI
MNLARSLRTSSNLEESPLAVTCSEENTSVQLLTPPEESAVVEQLWKQLEKMTAMFATQIQLNQALKHELKVQERLVQDKDLRKLSNTVAVREKQLEDQMKEHKNIPYLYNTAVLEKVELKQQLVNTTGIMNQNKDLELKKSQNFKPTKCFRSAGLAVPETPDWTVVIRALAGGAGAVGGGNRSERTDDSQVQSVIRPSPQNLPLQKLRLQQM